MDKVLNDLTESEYGRASRTPQTSSQFDLANVDSVRGIACFLLVSYHAVGSNNSVGMHLPADSLWHYAMSSFEYIRMPLFTTLSGLIYAGRRVTSSSLKSFLFKKGRRLGVPMVFAVAVIWTIRTAMYGHEVSFVEAIFFSYQQFWFVQSILIVFVGMALWDAFCRPSWVGLIIAAVAAVIIHGSFWLGTFLSLHQAVFLLPYFIFGMIVRLWPETLMRKESLTLAIGIAIVVIGRQQLIIWGFVDPVVHGLSVVICGMATALILIRCMPRSQFFETIGRYSFTIYLWHSLFSAIARLAVSDVVPIPNVMLFATMMLAGIGCPMLLEMLTAKHRWSVVFTGR